MAKEKFVAFQSATPNFVHIIQHLHITQCEEEALISCLLCESRLCMCHDLCKGCGFTPYILQHFSSFPTLCASCVCQGFIMSITSCASGAIVSACRSAPPAMPAYIHALDAAFTESEFCFWKEFESSARLTCLLPVFV